MTYKQYSDIQRCIGKLEGMGAALPDNLAIYYFDVLEVLDGVIEEIMEETNEVEK